MENVSGILWSSVQLDGLETINDNGKKQIINSDYPVAKYNEVAKHMARHNNGRWTCD